MFLSHKIKLDATNKQKRYFALAAGCSRFVWNLALAEWDRQHQAGGKPSWAKLQREFNATKYELYPWMADIHRDAHAAPFLRLGKAFRAFFDGISARPKFKKKGKSRDSFAVANDKFRVDGKTVVLPKIGRVRLTESLRFTGKIMGAVVSRTADQWFIAIQVDVGDCAKTRCGDGIVGVDLGVKVAATLSTGGQLQCPKPLKAAIKKLATANRELSRRKKGSKNRQKTKVKLAKIYSRIANIRQDWLHKLTTQLCHENQVVAIESLNVKGMIKNRCLARAISDIGFGEFSRQMKYKAPIYGVDLVIAERWYPSSKMCSTCGHIKTDLTLKERVYHCELCGSSIDRDLNAAINLRTLGLRGIAHGRLNSLGVAGAESVEVRTRSCPLVDMH